MPLDAFTQTSGRERTFDPSEVIVSKTDLSGKLTYGNRVFYRLADYSEKDCLGQQHNMIRHPDMPRGVFELLWKTIQSGEEIFAYVVNQSKNGDYYWVLAHVTPSRDASGNIIGYHSNRRVPNRAVIDQHIIPLYRKLLGIERSGAAPKDALAQSVGAVEALLAENRMTFNQFIFSLGI